MKKMQKNNKGFSLVELIVVILIMAIIAVALAPQVMKWVDESQVSTDNNNKATIKNAVDAAVADYKLKNGNLSETLYYKIQSNALTGISGTSNSGVEACIKEVLNNQYPDVKQDKNSYFLITIEKTGTVTVRITSGT